MTRYYFNENPQATQWRKKCEKLQEELDCAIDQLETMACCKLYTEERLEAVKNEVNNLERRMKRFNKLPWWRKMVYKFKV